jgi:hypothetical protein
MSRQAPTCVRNCFPLSHKKEPHESRPRKTHGHASRIRLNHISSVLRALLKMFDGAPAPFTVTVSTSGTAMLPPSLPVRFVPPIGIRVLLLLAFALALVIAGKNRRMFDSAFRARRLAWSGALTAIFLCSVFMGRAAVAQPLPSRHRPSLRRLSSCRPALRRSSSPRRPCPRQVSRCSCRRFRSL